MLMDLENYKVKKVMGSMHVSTNIYLANKMFKQCAVKIKTLIVPAMEDSVLGVGEQYTVVPYTTCESVREAAPKRTA